MPRRPLSEAERDLVRRRILDAAQELFDADGIEAVSMRAIGARVGLAASALYAYFPAKLDLIRALWHGALGELESRFRALSEAEPDPVQAVVKLGAAYAEFAMEQPVGFRLLFLTGGETIDADFVASDQSRTAYFLLRDRVAEGIAQGRLIVEDADLAAQILWSAIHGVLALAITHPSFPFHPPALLVETMTRTMLRGLGRGDEHGER